MNNLCSLVATSNESGICILQVSWKLLKFIDLNSKQSQSETHVCSIVIFFECSFMYDIGWRTPALQTAANHVGIYVTLLASMMYV